MMIMAIQKDGKNAFVDAKYARRDTGYHGDISEIMGKGICPFCQEHFRWHKKPIIYEENGWFITESSWPYENTEHHLLIIPHKHIVDLKGLTGEDFETAKKLAELVIKERNILGGGLTLRFGDTRYTGATVTHLHFHLISPTKHSDKDAAEVVNFPIG